MNRVKKINLREKFSLIEEYWSPKIAGELNGQYVKLAKFQGEFDWHCHKEEDELFLVLKGSITIDFRDKTVTVEAGEFLIIPKGIEHRPRAVQEAEVLLFEPKTTLNTGNVQSEKTKENLDYI